MTSSLPDNDVTLAVGPGVYPVSTSSAAATLSDLYYTRASAISLYSTHPPRATDYRLNSDENELLDGKIRYCRFQHVTPELERLKLRRENGSIPGVALTERKEPNPITRRPAY